jgi:hypothetical protein
MSQQRLYIANAFSLGMLPGEVYLRVKEIDAQTTSEILKSQQFISAVGHESTAKLLTALLGVEIPYNRIQVRLQKGDRLLVFQLLTRLEEGRVLDENELRRLPHKFYIVEVVE